MKIFSKLFTFGILLGFASCATSPHPQVGGLFSSYQGPNQGVASQDVSKKGESCASSILGLIAFGDASIETARAKAKITKISAVDYHRTSVLFFVYNSTCTVVSGS